MLSSRIGLMCLVENYLSQDMDSSRQADSKSYRIIFSSEHNSCTLGLCIDRVYQVRQLTIETSQLR